MSKATTEAIATIKKGKPPAVIDGAPPTPALTGGSDLLDQLLNEDQYRAWWRLATLFAQSSLVPKHLQGRPEDCLLALTIAKRMGEDPIQVLQSIHFIHGTAGWKTAYMVARFNISGIATGRIRYKTTGKGKTMAVTASATLAGTGEEISATVSMEMAELEGWTVRPKPHIPSKYESMPEHMLSYRAATFMIRRHAPEVMHGMQTVGEIEDVHTARSMVDVTPAPKAIERAAAVRAELAAPTTTETVEETPEPDQPTTNGQTPAPGFERDPKTGDVIDTETGAVVGNSDKMGIGPNDLPERKEEETPPPPTDDDGLFAGMGG